MILKIVMMSLWPGSSFSTTGPWWRKPPVTGGFPLQWASSEDLWYSSCCQPEEAVEQTVELSLISDAMTLMQCHYNWNKYEDTWCYESAEFLECQEPRGMTKLFLECARISAILWGIVLSPLSSFITILTCNEPQHQCPTNTKYLARYSLCCWKNVMVLII